jgi:hypothetical protein
MMNPNPNPNPPPPVDELALAGAMTAAASSLRAVRRTLTRLVAEAHGLLGDRDLAAVVLDGEELAAALDRLAGRLRPQAKTD